MIILSNLYIAVKYWDSETINISVMSFSKSIFCVFVVLAKTDVYLTKSQAKVLAIYIWRIVKGKRMFFVFLYDWIALHF